MIYLDIQSPVGTLLIAGHDEDKSVVPVMKNGLYEPHIQLLLNKVIKPDFKCLDIGANYGQHTVLLSKMADKVFAVEASPENSVCLRHTLEANDCKNVEVTNRAIWSESKELVLSFTPTNSACSFLSTEEYHQDNEELISMEAAALDDLFDGPFDFIKMDIEGSELAALNGGEQVFGSSSRLLVELNAFTCKSFMGIEISQVIDKITSLGYNKQYMFSSQHGDWAGVTTNQLKHFFDTGAVLIDVYFTKE